MPELGQGAHAASEQLAERPLPPGSAWPKLKPKPGWAVCLQAAGPQLTQAIWQLLAGIGSLAGLPRLASCGRSRTE